MAILAERQRVIDTFVASELAMADETPIINSKAYRAYKGEEFDWSFDIDEGDAICQWYNEYNRII